VGKKKGKTQTRGSRHTNDYENVGGLVVQDDSGEELKETAKKKKGWHN